ncbi:MAG: type II toxin-antitoxin system HicB family antitoxin [Patescibacteria group bacterium]
MEIPVLLEQLSEEDNWTATVPYVPECISEGETPESAVKNLVEAIAALSTVTPDIYTRLQNPPHYLLTQVDISPKST